MRGIDLRITASDWRRIRELCLPSFRGARDTELGMIGLLGTRSARGQVTELLIPSILWPEDGDIINKRRHALTFSSRYLRRAHLAMRTKGLAGIVTFHTHPFSDHGVDFSFFDDSQDPLLLENLQELHPKTWLASVVLGAESQRGRLWTSPSRQVALSTLISVGDRIEYLALSGDTKPDEASPSEVFDRAKALTGTGAMARLSGSTALVVGASGTGSLICELLARAGCRRVMVADPDVVKPANLNRILYATCEDAKRRTPKPEVLKRGIEGLGLGCEIVPINSSILDRAVMRHLNEADFLLGCLDADFPRALLCKYSYQYLVPYIDMGTEIGGDDEGIVSLDSRVSYIAPRSPCLRCCGFISPRRLAFESLTAQERKRRIAQGYCDDLLLKQPAVMDLNMRAASAGMLLLRHLLQPFLLEPLPLALKENFVTANMKRITTPRAPSDTCDICQANPHAGFGDCGPQIGLPSETVRAIAGGNGNGEEEDVA